ncbi:hypothetical protein [Branchiibius sp. NY16-3462-2]|uniref:phenylacetate--CoA ligase family protein n=1 Tax=Branchiibius sp. NY16-3462-2 TaxID=1807500 RepID=UPI000797C2E4|nr:hypothetical protein [Branchiibius sp. NY16-3462-2]KYH45855.1 hypothetical protein AZH51_09215 [Branchiibius sp. NY16-3462-2]
MKSDQSLRQVAFSVKTGTVRRGAGRFYDELMRNQTLSVEELAQLQQQRASEIARFAITHTSFYRRHYSELGIEKVDLDDPLAWSQLPIIDRTVVKENAPDFFSDEAQPKYQRKALTGGSTGQPLRTAHDARVPSLALSWRMYSWWGVQPWDNLARVARWGFGWKEDLKNAAAWWPTRQRYLDAALISEESMQTFLGELQKTKPALLEGYVGAMLEFAGYVESHGARFPSLKALATTAAPLTQAARNRLESVFGCPVYDEYRGSEFGWMAGECAAHAGLHTFADVRRIEVVDPDGKPLPPGEVGDLVITDLTNRVFPLIRYRNGDRGMLLEGICPCGISLPRMAPVDGRTTDVLRLPSGRSMNHRLLAMFSDIPEAVEMFQIHQRSDYSIVVRVVRGGAPDADQQIDGVVEGLRERIGREVPVIVEYVDDLPYTGGKIKFVISDVSSEQTR